ncbi:MAG: molybdopterin-dependent oxidoreductase [Candidatus Marinimicrobia bacterium]|nr:molybdopterin-dependent oxidoreductase [Candidatus Neomarinimicrobiota bacterium]
MPFVKIDNAEFEVEVGTTVLEAAKAEGIEIPHYCYHPALEIVGSCRMCMVQIEGMPKLQVACNTTIGNTPPDRKIAGKYDMVVHTQSDIVKQERKNILEFLLLNHPLDCPVCDQAGECDLQDYTFKYGNSHSRFEEDKRVSPGENLGSGVVINRNRCIMCTRCVRFTRQISGTGELFVENRGYSSEIAILEEKPLHNLMAGNVVDICPVGALLGTDYIHTNRIWNLERQSSICQDCSTGCNIYVYYQDDRIFRVSSRENHDVNGYFMCDIGRYGFHRFEECDRVTSPMIRKNDELVAISWEGALKEVLDNFTRKKGEDKPIVGGIVSPLHTNETVFMFGRLMNNIFKERAVVGALPPMEEETDTVFKSGFRISRDRSPNWRGLKDLYPSVADDFLTRAKKDKIRLMYALDDGVDRELTQEWDKVLKKMDFLTVQTYAMTPLAQLAHLILPGPAPFEREGTLTNDKGRIQWLIPSMPLKGKARPDWAIIMEVMNTVGKRELSYSGVGEVLAEMGKRFPAYEGVSLFRLGDYGLSTNGEVKAS